MLRTGSQLTVALVGTLLLVLAGCNNNETPLSAEAEKSSPATGSAPNPDRASPLPGADPAGVHGHKQGTHGGFIVEIGRDNYHAEAVFGKNGSVRVHLLGKDEARVQEVELQTLTAYVRAAGGGEAVPFTLEAAPRTDDSPGKTSVFAGKLPADLAGKAVEITVPSIRISGERFRFGIQNAAPADHPADMPAALADEEEKQLYLTPGGKYSEADIRANGGQTAAQKFQGQMARHDLAPRPGDRVCPITLTRANPKFSWVVGGKTYEFCCPPCVDEFVKSAKETPGEIKEPGDYVKH